MDVNSMDVKQMGMDVNSKDVNSMDGSRIYSISQRLRLQSPKRDMLPD